MARAGRKRNNRVSYLGRSPRRADARELVAQQPHRSWLPPDKRLSEKAATPFGGLNLIGVITDAQYEAGQRYRIIVSEYRVSIGIPDPGSVGGKGYACRGERNCAPCECRARKERYDGAFAALSEAGHQAAKSVARVAVHDEACPPGMVRELVRGLAVLVRHFGLNGRRR